MSSELFPILSTPDLSRALRFYRDALGGTVSYEHPGPDGALAYVGIEIGAGHVRLAAEAEPTATSRGRITLRIHTEDCDSVVERMRAEGARILEEPRDQPWGERTARVLDPDGHELIVGPRGGRSRDSLGASLLSPDPALYTRPEYERRFLVAPDAPWRMHVERYSKVFRDLYIRRTHLRLRTLSDSATGGEFIKLTKKLESDSPYVQMVGSIPLSPMEYEFIAALEGNWIRKVRHYHFYRGNVFSIDVFQGELEGLVMCEVETGSLEELMRVAVPDYATREVTEDPFFTGGNLSRISREELAGRV